MTNERITRPSLKQIEVRDDFWSPRQRLVMDVTIPCMERTLEDKVPGAVPSHALDNFRIAAGESEGPHRGMVFQDSDVYKWLEAAAYSLSIRPDPQLMARADAVIAIIAKAQRRDGYLNTYFTLAEPDGRWRNLMECHELYCAGHLMEAAAAYLEATGKRELMAVAERFARHIISVFGEGGREGVPGHQEVEIGLMRLYRATGKREYLDMAERFLRLRGQDPEYFLKNTPAHPGVRYGGYEIDPHDTDYNQSYAPVCEQTEARGHAVRCVYMLTAMADVAAENGCGDMERACRAMFRDIVSSKMYVTGGIGSKALHESFSEGFDLPNDTGYGETCAAVGMAFFARNMLALSPMGEYADVLEREFYNGALAGMQLDGRRYFYVNPLEMDPATAGTAEGYEHVQRERQKWNACACCPPNLVRLIVSLGGYLWGESGETVYSHLFIGSLARLSHADIELETKCPWEGFAKYTLRRASGGSFTIAIHIPEYAENARARVNGADAPESAQDGYLRLRRQWREGDGIEIAFNMPPRRVYMDSRVTACRGQAALARGPIVYCLEGADNPWPLDKIILPRDARLCETPYDPDTLGGIVAIKAQALLETENGEKTPVTITAIPYYAWSNRGISPMRVWIREM